MALPTTVEANPSLYGRNPPHKSSGGDYYTVHGTSVSNIKVRKATDPSVSWTTQDTANGPQIAPDRCIASVSDGTFIHIVSANSTSLLIQYHRFDMSTDTWSQVSNLVADVSGMSAPAAVTLWCSIALRAGVTGDELVIAASGSTDAIMGSAYERIDFWHGADTGTPSWTGPVAIDAAGEISYYQPALVSGSGDNTHVFWGEDNNGTRSNSARTISGSNTLSTIRNSAGNNSNNSTDYSLVYYNDGGTHRVLSVHTSENFELGCLRATESAGNIGALTYTTVVPQGSLEPTGHVHTLVHSDGDLYALWSGGGNGGVDRDLYYSLSTDAGATWDAAVEELDAVTVNYISAYLLDTGKIAYLYDDANFTKYNELVLAVVPAIVGDLTITVTPAATLLSYTLNADIVGAQTISLTPTATLDYRRNADIVGSQSITVTPSATLLYSVGFFNYSIVGAQTVSVTPAATLNYTANHSIVGAQTITVSPVATLDYRRNVDIVGSHTISITPAAAMSYASNHAIIGAQTITASIGATLDYRQNPSIVGSQTITASVGATLDFTQNAAIVGAQTISVTPAATLNFGDNAQIIGAQTVNVSPAATLDYTQHLSIAGSQTITASIGAILDYRQHPSIVGLTTASLTPVSVMDYTQHLAIVGASTITANVGGVMSFAGANQIAGDVAINLSVNGVTSYTQNAALVGSLTISAAVSAQLSYARHFAIAGALNIQAVPAATLDYQQHPTIVGSVTITNNVTGITSYTRHAAIVGGLNITIIPAAGLAISTSGSTASSATITTSGMGATISTSGNQAAIACTGQGATMSITP